VSWEALDLAGGEVESWVAVGEDLSMIETIITVLLLLNIPKFSVQTCFL